MDQDLVNKLITHYEQAIKQINKKWFWWTAQLLASELGVKAGVCYCSMYVFHKVIASSSLVKNNIVPGTGYWCTPVYDASTKKEIIQLLQKRVDILKTFKPSTS